MNVCDIKGSNEKPGLKVSKVLPTDERQSSQNIFSVFFRRRGSCVMAVAGFVLGGSVFFPKILQTVIVIGGYRSLSLRLSDRLVDLFLTSSLLSLSWLATATTADGDISRVRVLQQRDYFQPNVLFYSFE